jgi:hypothetical protein
MGGAGSLRERSNARPMDVTATPGHWAHALQMAPQMAPLLPE